jgi:hypothetical protein
VGWAEHCRRLARTNKPLGAETFSRSCLVFDFLPTDSSSSDDGNDVPISVGVVTGRRPRQLVPFAVLTRLVDAGGSGSSSRCDLAAEHWHRARVRSGTDRAVAGSFGLRTSEGRAGLPNRSRHVTALVVPTPLSPRPSGLGDHSKLSFMPYPSPGTSSFSLWSMCQWTACVAGALSAARNARQRRARLAISTFEFRFKRAETPWIWGPDRRFPCNDSPATERRLKPESNVN